MNPQEYCEFKFFLKNTQFSEQKLINLLNMYPNLKLDFEYEKDILDLLVESDVKITKKILFSYLKKNGQIKFSTFLKLHNKNQDKDFKIFLIKLTPFIFQDKVENEIIKESLYNLSTLEDLILVEKIKPIIYKTLEISTN